VAKLTAKKKKKRQGAAREIERESALLVDAIQCAFAGTTEKGMQIV
jgi:hypothetical protein